MAELHVGDAAPKFTAINQDENSVSLDEFKGQIIVLYFYPKDDTPGCTKEACGFRDMKDEYAKNGAVVYGVSKDSVQAHQKFREKYELNFPLLSDEDGSICESYGVLKEKTNFGKKSVGIERTTFVIDKAGDIAAIFPKVKVDGHVDEVLEKVRSLQ